MGTNLYRFMQKNNIPIGGKNRQEITRQVRNIAAGDISVGIWGETETHKFSSRNQFKIAKKVSFWIKKNPNEPQFWEPYLTLSDDFMTVLGNHCFLLDIEPLVLLQSNPRAMDMYMWISYRIASVKHPVKISYSDLHSIFGAQTKRLNDFKTDFKKAVRQALPYISNAEIDMSTDTKHIILRSQKRQAFYLTKGEKPEIVIEEGVFGELKMIGLSPVKIKQLAKQSNKEQLAKAVAVTKQGMEAGNVKNPPGFFTRALKEKWEPSKTEEAEEAKESPQDVTIDESYENKISDPDWRQVRKLFIKQYGNTTFNNWVKDICEVEIKEGTATLVALSSFKATWVEKHYLNNIKKYWHEINKEVEEVKIIVKPNKAK